MTNDRASRLTPDLRDDLPEELSILSTIDRLDICTDQPNAVFPENSIASKCHRSIEGGLTSERGKDRIRALLLDDPLEELSRDRFHVGRISELRIGHDRRWIAVDQDDANALLLENTTGLSA